MEYIEWNIDKLNDYLKNKIRRRGVDSKEYNFLTTYIKKLHPEIIVDVGTFLGISGYILGTSSPTIEKLYAIENIDDESFVPYGYEGENIPRENYGMYLPDDAIFRTNGYHNDLTPILEENKNKDIFVFLDAKKQTLGVLDELKICYDHKVKYVGLHDTSKWYKHPRRAVQRVINLKWYKLVDEKYIDDIGEKTKGVSILKLVED